MVAKSVKLEGYGEIMINPINFKEKTLETVDATGTPVTAKTIGERARSIYVNQEGIEVPRSQVCKKIVIEGEDIITPKFQPTKEISKDNITETDDNGIVYRGIDRKFYSVVTDNAKIKELVIEQNKTLEFPFVGGAGWKIWKGVLTNWNNKLLLVAIRGDIQRELDKYDEDTVDLELEIMPQQKNMKELVTAMAMV